MSEGYFSFFEKAADFILVKQLVGVMKERSNTGHSIKWDGFTFINGY